jgi:putative protease
MQNNKRRPEVLAPAGDWERFQFALQYGADAIYLGGKQFTMRAAPANFSTEQLAAAVQAAHAKGVKVYLTCNTLPHNAEIPQFVPFLQEVVQTGVDAVIVADLGLLSLIRRYAPDLEVHMSTQTGIVNYETANMLYEMGVKRVVLARELSLEEIAEIRAKTPKELELEAFVHGAMCVSFSGRCLLSAYLTGRDANQGACAQPCRWKYHLMEETRPGQYFPVEEHDEGTYIMNAKDLCMIDHIPELMAAGVDSLKLEGRAKSSYYVAVVTNAYRAAVDAYLAQPTADFVLPAWIRDEVYKVSHRGYCTGFFFGKPEHAQRYEDNSYDRSFDVVAIVDDWKDGMLYVTQRNRFFAEDTVELLAPEQKPLTLPLNGVLYDGEGAPITVANHAMMPCAFPCPVAMPKGTIVRRQVAVS